MLFRISYSDSLYWTLYMGTLFKNKNRQFFEMFQKKTEVWTIFVRNIWGDILGIFDPLTSLKHPLAPAPALAFGLWAPACVQIAVRSRCVGSHYPVDKNQVSTRAVKSNRAKTLQNWQELQKLHNMNYGNIEITK